jgi:DNA replication protein DnaC
MIPILGDQGSGKSMIAVELMFEVTEKLKSAYYVTAMDFFTRVRATFQKDSEETTLSIMDKLKSKRFLVVEELSRRCDTPFENNLMFELLNARYNSMADTLIIDNSTKENFLANIDPALAGRIKETGGIIEADWGSFR